MFARPNTPNYYAVLGVPPTASSRDVKRAYRQNALLHHPDRCSSRGGPGLVGVTANPDAIGSNRGATPIMTRAQATEEEKKATAQFQLLGEAYTVLSSDEQREAYDSEFGFRNASTVVEGEANANNSSSLRPSNPGGNGESSSEPSNYDDWLNSGTTASIFAELFGKAQTVPLSTTGDNKQGRRAKFDDSSEKVNVSQKGKNTNSNSGGNNGAGRANRSQPGRFVFEGEEEAIGSHESTPGSPSLEELPMEDDPSDLQQGSRAFSLPDGSVPISFFDAPLPASGSTFSADGFAARRTATPGARGKPQQRPPSTPVHQPPPPPQPQPQRTGSTPTGTSRSKETNEGRIPTGTGNRPEPSVKMPPLRPQERSTPEPKKKVQPHEQAYGERHHPHHQHPRHAPTLAATEPSSSLPLFFLPEEEESLATEDARQKWDRQFEFGRHGVQRRLQSSSMRHRTTRGSHNVEGRPPSHQRTSQHHQHEQQHEHSFQSASTPMGKKTGDPSVVRPMSRAKSDLGSYSQQQQHGQSSPPPLHRQLHLRHQSLNGSSGTTMRAGLATATSNQRTVGRKKKSGGDREPSEEREGKEPQFARAGGRRPASRASDRIAEARRRTQELFFSEVQ